jgi:hypothetical protein
MLLGASAYMQPHRQDLRQDANDREVLGASDSRRSASWSLAVGDVDGDGDQEIINRMEVGSLEVAFEYVCDMTEKKIFRKRK